MVVQAWNGTSMLRPLRLADPDAEFWSDASGGWGCGAHWQGRWFQVAWQSLPIAAANIAAKELFPIVAAALVWGREWRGLTVRANCDNSAVVEVINNHSANSATSCDACFSFAPTSNSRWSHVTRRASSTGPRMLCRVIRSPIFSRRSPSTLLRPPQSLRSCAGGCRSIARIGPRRSGPVGSSLC